MFWAEPSIVSGFSTKSLAISSLPEDDDLWESTRTLALLNVAIADSYVAVFDAKYHYQFWRPTMAIRGADTDGNEKTTSDPNWLPLLPRRRFRNIHQVTRVPAGALRSYLRAHSAVTRRSPRPAPRLPAYIRNFSNFDEASRECVEGRMLSGAHFRFANEDALYLGQHISRYVLRTILVRVH